MERQVQWEYLNKKDKMIGCCDQRGRCLMSEAGSILQQGLECWTWNAESQWRQRLRRESNKWGIHVDSKVSDITEVLNEKLQCYS